MANAEAELIEQLKHERKINRELASRLQTARHDAETFRRKLEDVHPQLFECSPRSRSLLKRILAVQACGLHHDEVIPLLTVAAGLEVDGSPDLSSLASVMSGKCAHKPCNINVPIVDAFAIVGPSHEDVASALQEHWQLLQTSSSQPASSHAPLCTLTPRILHFVGQDGSTRAGAEAAGLSDFGCPSGATLRLLDPIPEVQRILPTCAPSSSSSSLPAARAVYEALIDRHGIRRGPRTHTFILTSGLGGGGRGATENDALAASSAARVISPHVPILPSPTRYALAFTATLDVLSRGILRHRAGVAAASREAEAAASADDVVVCVPSVFVLVSRYPWMPAHWEVLKACVRAAHVRSMNALAVAYEAGACGWLDVARAKGSRVPRRRESMHQRSSSAGPHSHSAGVAPTALVDSATPAPPGQRRGSSHAAHLSLPIPPVSLPIPPVSDVHELMRARMHELQLGWAAMTAGMGTGKGRGALQEPVNAHVNPLHMQPQPEAPPPSYPRSACPLDGPSMLAAVSGAPPLPLSVWDLIRAYSAAPVPQPGHRMRVSMGAAGQEAADLFEGLYASWGEGECDGDQEKPSSTPVRTVPTHIHYTRPPCGTGPPTFLGADLSSPESRSCAAEWALPVLFSLLPLDSVLLLLGAALTEYKIVIVGGAMSAEAVSACVWALHSLLHPCVWAGPCLPTLPRTLLELLYSPVPTLVGVSELPLDWTQDDGCVVLLLDKETVRIPRAASVGTAGGPAGGHGRGGLGEADVPGFLQLQIPGNSVLCHELAGLAAQMRPPVPVTGSGVRPRPCYRPTPAQVRACTQLMAAFSQHISGLLSLLFAHEAQTVELARQCTCAGGSIGGEEALRSAVRAMRFAPSMAARVAALTLTVPEVEVPFWHRFSASQMVSGYADETRLAACWALAGHMVEWTG